MYKIKVLDKDEWIPKTPYNKEEQRRGITTKPERVAVYKSEKRAKRVKALQEIFLNIPLEIINTEENGDQGTMAE